MVIKEVAIPCLLCALLIVFLGMEQLIWRMSSSYPLALARVEYVDDEEALTAADLRQICRSPLPAPVVVRKANGLFLRCGSPGLEGVYLLSGYKQLTPAPFS